MKDKERKHMTVTTNRDVIIKFETQESYLRLHSNDANYLYRLMQDGFVMGGTVRLDNENYCLVANLIQPDYSIKVIKFEMKGK